MSGFYPLIAQCVSGLISDCTGLVPQYSYIVGCTLFFGTAVFLLLHFIQLRGNKTSKVRFDNSTVFASMPLLSNEEILKLSPVDVVPLIGSRLVSSLSPAENAQRLLRSLLLSGNGLSLEERLCLAYCMQIFHRKPEELIVPQSLLESHDPDAMGSEVRPLCREAARRSGQGALRVGSAFRKTQPHSPAPTHHHGRGSKSRARARRRAQPCARCRWRTWTGPSTSGSAPSSRER